MAAAAAFPLFFVLHSRVVSPRPYFISEIDIEQDYYYNARLLARGLSIGSSHHPGTPVYCFSSYLLRISGVEVEDTQRFFSVAYWVVAIASAAVVLYFCLTVLRGVRPWAAVTAVTLLFSWPPVLSYWTYYGADSWSFGLSLLMVSLFWNDLSSRGGSKTRAMLCGTVAGAGLAVKMTFLPLVLSVLLAEVVRMATAMRRTSRDGAGGRKRRLREAGAHSAVLTAALAGTYFAATAPILGRLAGMWYDTFHRPDVKPPTGDFAVSLASTVTALWSWNPALVLSGSFIIVAFVHAGISLSARSLRRAPEEETPAEDPNGHFDYAASGVFLSALLLALFYTLASSAGVTPGAELGIRLRNTAPTALVLPMMILFVERARLESSRSWLRRKTGWSLAMLGAAAFVLAWVAISGHRRTFVATRMARSREVRAQFAPPAEGPQRVAFWTGAADDHFGEVSFHFWGNYRYGHDQFDEELLRRFPGHALLRLRDMARIRDAGLARAPRGRATSRYGKLGDAAWEIIHWVPPYRRELALVTGEETRIRPSTLVFAESQLFELRGVALPAYVEALERRFGPLRLERKVIAGEIWIILEAAPGLEPST
jgi:hypothetical protein